MRTSRETGQRLKITLVKLTYPKALTGRVPLCPLIFSCLEHKNSDHKIVYFAERDSLKGTPSGGGGGGGGGGVYRYLS